MESLGCAMLPQCFDTSFTAAPFAPTISPYFISIEGQYCVVTLPGRTLHIISEEFWGVGLWKWSHFHAGSGPCASTLSSISSREIDVHRDLGKECTLLRKLREGYALLRSAVITSNFTSR